VSKQSGEFDIVHTHTDHFLCLAKEMMPAPLVRRKRRTEPHIKWSDQELG